MASPTNSPSVWALYWNWSFCFSPFQTPFYPDPSMCLLMRAFIAPFAVIFGPLAFDHSDAQIRRHIASAFALALREFLAAVGQPPLRLRDMVAPLDDLPHFAKMPG